MAIEQRALDYAKVNHVPMEAVSLPNLLGQGKVSNGVVSPITTVAPAPMGLGTYGVMNTTGTPTAYNISTTSWEGSMTFNNFNEFLVANDGTLSTNGTYNSFGIQLNTVTVNTTVFGNDNMSFWTQNVLYFNFPAPGYVTPLDNIWNFSSPAVDLTNGTINVSTPAPGSLGGCSPWTPAGYFYCFGAPVPYTLPMTVHLYLNSSVTNNSLTGDAYSTVSFGYDFVNGSGHSFASGIYNTVEFNSTSPIGTFPVSPFLVSGSQLTPTNFLLYDAEIMIGGPGGGTTSSFFGLNGSAQLQYWNSTSSAYLNPPSAWNVGADTGETSEGVAGAYSTPGTVLLSSGPSLPEPLWNATPGGNLGVAKLSGTISPSNAFIFLTQGSAFNTSFAAWSPTQTASTYSIAVSPGTYTVNAMLSDYKMIQKTVTLTAATPTSRNLVLVKSTGAGVYTPLWAWDNAQLASISKSGSGIPGAPYTLFDGGHGLNPVFGEMNDYLYQVFPAVLLADTTAYVEITGSAAVFDVNYAWVYLAALHHLGLPTVNEQPIELFGATNVKIWGLRDISGWFFYEDYGPTGFLPLANVVLFGASNDLVGDSTFQSQGSSLLLASIFGGPMNNVVWGNRFTNSSTLSPTMYPGDGSSNGPPVGIFEYEAGDLLYNNYVATSITAYSIPANIFTGGPQSNLDNWNLSTPEPPSYHITVLGEKLKGTIVPSAAEGGNYWSNFLASAGLPYDNYGYIVQGGDSFPLPLYKVTFSMTGVHPVKWFVQLNITAVFNYTATSTTPPIHSVTFFAPAGTFAYNDSVISGGGTIIHLSGTVTVVNHGVTVTLKHT